MCSLLLYYCYNLSYNLYVSPSIIAVPTCACFTFFTQNQTEVFLYYNYFKSGTVKGVVS